jgi:2',3'-cyclic-nucleotide 2'-phosphodiesterase (5'-nucleotidase family)
MEGNMKHLKRTIITVTAVVYVMAAKAAVSGGQVDTLTIIHVNDSHSNLTPYGAAEYGGIARAASVIGMWKAANPNPILVHGGDFMVGTLMFNAYFGVPELQILNALGFDALCLGNHEFDVGPEQLGGFFAMAQIDSAFNILCTNAVNLDSVPALKAVVRPYAIERRGNIKVGLLGLTTPAANVESNPAPVVLSDKIEDILGQRIMELKAVEGCQVIILISHMGLAVDEQIAQGLSGVDAIISGHSHDALDKVVAVNGIPIVQAGEFYRYVGKLRLAYDGSKTSVVDYELREITSAIPAEPTIQATVDQLKLGVSAQFGPVIGDPFMKVTEAPRRMNYKPVAFDTLDTPVGNLFTSAMLNAVKGADCAIEATGHIVENLYPGPVTTADLFRAYPYGYEKSDGLGFRLASFDLSGAQIWGVVQALLGYVDPQTGSYDYLMQSAGLDYTIDASNPDAGLRLAKILINGVPIQQDSVYRVVSSSQIVGYLQKLFQITPANLTLYPISVFQVAKEYISAMDTLRYWRTGHNLAVAEPVAVNEKRTGMARGFELRQNYPNPFNSGTVFHFTLPGSARVTFEICNIRGERVACLLSGGLMSAGEHAVKFDAEGLTSGIYLYRIRAEGFAQTKKMMLLR